MENIFGEKKEFPVHFWLRLESGHYVDYRARMWFPNASANEIPNGVFHSDDYPYTKYIGEPITVTSRYILSDELIKIIAMPIPKDLIDKMKKQLPKR